MRPWPASVVTKLGKGSGGSAKKAATSASIAGRLSLSAKRSSPPRASTSAAVSVRACIASPLTSRPSSVSVVRSARAARISFSPSTTAFCPIATCAPVPKAVTTCRGERLAARSNDRRRVLARDGQNPGPRRPEVVEKRLEGTAKRLRIEQAKYPAEGVVTGQAILQAKELPQELLAVLGEFRKVHAALRTTDRRHQRDRQNVEQVVPPGIALPRIGDLPENANQ